MIFYTVPTLRYLERLLEASGLYTEGVFTFKQFANQEWHIGIDEDVYGQICCVLGSITPPDTCLINTLLLADTLKKEGAASVVVILPYLAYTRQDKLKSHESLATAWVGKLFAASGIDRVITIDIHSEKSRQLFPIPTINISPATLFVDELLKSGWQDATIVAPDEGAWERAEEIRTLMLSKKPIVYLKKIRHENKIVHSELIGNVGKRAVVVDDILDTGSTLISACGKLVLQGVENIAVAVTHGLFTGDRWEQLFKENVTKIFCTNSTPTAERMIHKSIVVLSVAPLIKQVLNNLKKKL